RAKRRDEERSAGGREWSCERWLLLELMEVAGDGGRDREEDEVRCWRGSLELMLFSDVNRGFQQEKQREAEVGREERWYDAAWVSPNKAVSGKRRGGGAATVVICQRWRPARERGVEGDFDGLKDNNKN
ncbi:hypothetical protein HAX54_047873, partial [Datura stramonium]|nr:hypothetical protein [Datura stramonium]